MPQDSSPAPRSLQPRAACVAAPRRLLGSHALLAWQPCSSATLQLAEGHAIRVPPAPRSKVMSYHATYDADTNTIKVGQPSLRAATHADAVLDSEMLLSLHLPSNLPSSGGGGGEGGGGGGASGGGGGLGGGSVVGRNACFICGQEGHWAKDCSKKRDKRAAVSGAAVSARRSVGGAGEQQQRLEEKARAGEAESALKNVLRNGCEVSGPVRSRAFHRLTPLLRLFPFDALFPF